MDVRCSIVEDFKDGIRSRYEKSIQITTIPNPDNDVNSTKEWKPALIHQSTTSTCELRHSKRLGPNSGNFPPSWNVPEGKGEEFCTIDRLAGDRHDVQ